MDDDRLHETMSGRVFWLKMTTRIAIGTVLAIGSMFSANADMAKANADAERAKADAEMFKYMQQCAAAEKKP